jgi:nitrite reductase (NO-forming)
MRRLAAHLLGTLLALLLPLVAQAAKSNLPKEPASYTPDASFTLETAIAEGQLVFIGVGGSIDKVVDPTLHVGKNAIVQITLVNGDGAVHDISVEDFQVLSDRVMGKGASTVVAFRADRDGTFPYFCTMPGHRAAGMEGKLVVGAAPVKVATPTAPAIDRDPTDLPPLVGSRAPRLVKVHLEAKEVMGQLADGVTYPYWTFDGKVPGPFLRVREGDTVELHLRNKAGNRMIHSIDLHAVTGPGGGSAVLQVPPGQEKILTFKALNPGLFVYHCATPMVANHIANGMYGMILVEPPGGLPPVDHEFYVMQGEVYTTGKYGQHGDQEFDVRKLLDEHPEYMVLNGAVGSLTKDHPLHAKVGDRVRIFFGVGGPNRISSFHVIGEIFDKVFTWGSLTTAPATAVQTVTVPPGGAAMVELRLEVPGKYLIVDHSLSRMERGLVGYLLVEGPASPEIYHAGPAISK